MTEIQSTIIEIYKKYEVDEVDNNYFLKAKEILQKEFPKEKYHYTRFFQKLGDKIFLHIRITLKNA